MKFQTLRRTVALAMFLSVASAGHPLAHSPRDPSSVGNVNRLAEKSVFVIRGKAVDVRYHNLMTSSGSIPYTFVTYKVDEVISGAPPPLVTLRFVGGPDGTGGFLAVTGVPLFQAGDQDILFVSNNGMDTAAENSCALVECEFGRYKIVNGAVYEAHGIPVVSVANGKISADGVGPKNIMDITVPAPSFDDMMRKPEFVARIRMLGLTVAQARARYAAEAPKTITIGQEMSDPPENIPDKSLSSTAQKRSLVPNVGLDSLSFIGGIRIALKSADKAKFAGTARPFRNAYLTTSVSLSTEAEAPPVDPASEKTLPTIVK